MVGWLLAGLARAVIYPQAKVQPAASTRAVIDRHCVACDSDKMKAGGLVLSTLDPGNPGDMPDVWEKVVRQLRGRYMPPAGRPRSDAQT